jgi:hypothetical protein
MFYVIAGDELAARKKFSQRGIYVCKSRPEFGFFRAGAGGMGSGNLTKRLRLHGTPEGRGNWTVSNRPWRPIWVLEVHAGVSGPTVELLESLLFGLLGARYMSVSRSGFQAEGDDIDLVSYLEGHLDKFDAILSRQHLSERA